MSIDLKAICDDVAGGLWEATKHDWELSIHHCLTEPTCPTAVVRPEGWSINRYRVDCDTIEESLQKTIDLVKREVIDRLVVGSYCPFTNPDDDVYAKWLYARAAGSNEEFPEWPLRQLPETFGWILDGFLKDNAGGVSKLIAERGERHATSYIAATVQRMVGDDRLNWDEMKAIIGPKLGNLK